MLLYHVRFDLENESSKFTPRTPTYGMQGEDSNISRVCVSTSIEGALSACPSGHRRLKIAKDIQLGLVIIYRIDTEKLGINDIILTEDLLQHNVYDAYLTGECWILEEFEVPPEDVLVRSIKSWDKVKIAMENAPMKPTISLISNVQSVPDNSDFITTDKVEQVRELWESIVRADILVDDYGTHTTLTLWKYRDSEVVLRLLRSIVTSSKRYERNIERFSLVYNSSFQVRNIERGMHLGSKFYSLLDPTFDGQQINEIRQGLEEGLDASLYANSNIHWQAMLVLRKALNLGLDISEYVYDDVSYADIEEYIRKFSKIVMKKSSSF